MIFTFLEATSIMLCTSLPSEVQEIQQPNQPISAVNVSTNAVRRAFSVAVINYLPCLPRWCEIHTLSMTCSKSAGPVGVLTMLGAPHAVF